jgi:tetratricopeptide (TPR) repeat protein|tara:strand:- start:4564 stop:4974 length:411 start_codon:yes stop_codon:yes gene_type:complete
MNPSEEQLQREAQEMSKYYQIACEKFQEEKFQEAIDWFSKSINVSKYAFNTSAIVNRGIARMAVKQYKEAIEDFSNPLVKNNEAERNETDQILHYTNLGYCYYMIGKINEAKNCYQKVLSIDQYNSDAKYMLSKMH